MGRSNDEYKMDRITYNRRAQQMSGGQYDASANSSDSEEADMRDRAARVIGDVDFREQTDGQAPQWNATSSGRNYITYDPNYQYGAAAGEPNYGVREALTHELMHEVADRQYTRPDDPALRAYNMHLPGQSIDDPALGASVQAQSGQIDSNWETARQVMEYDSQLAQYPDWQDYVRRRMDYAQASPNVHNETVAGEVYSTLRQNGLGNTQTAHQMRAIYSEAAGRIDMGGQARPVARTEPRQSSSSGQSSSRGSSSRQSSSSHHHSSSSRHHRSGNSSGRGR